MNRMSTTALDLLGTGALDLTAGSMSVLAVTTGYTFDAADANLSDIAGGVRIGDVTLGARTFTGGVFADGTSVTVPSAAGLVLKGLWVYVDTGVEATSTLVFWMDQNSDGTAMGGTTTVDGIVVPWSGDGIAVFSAISP